MSAEHTGDDHLVAEIRTTLAEGSAHRLSVRVEVDGDAVVLRGPVETDAAHRLVVDEVRRALDAIDRELRVVDELHVPVLESRPPEAIR